MKAKIFSGDNFTKAIDAFNTWAKGKALARDVIIHTIYCPATINMEETIAIVVYHPEDPQWDKTEPTLTAPISTRDMHVAEETGG